MDTGLSNRVYGSRGRGGDERGSGDRLAGLGRRRLGERNFGGGDFVPVGCAEERPANYSIEAHNNSFLREF